VLFLCKTCWDKAHNRVTDLDFGNTAFLLGGPVKRASLALRQWQALAHFTASLRSPAIIALRCGEGSESGEKQRNGW
jgi:hypothetical protein